MDLSTRQRFWTKHRVDVAMQMLTPAQLNRVEKLSTEQFWECFASEDGLKVLEAVGWPLWLEDVPRNSPIWSR